MLSARVELAYLLDYRILRHRPELGDTEPQFLADTRSADTTFTDTDVEPGTLYEYRVKAATFTWFSDASEPVEISTEESTSAVNTALMAEFLDTPPAHGGEDTTVTFELRFSEEPKPDFSYKTLRDHAFTVTGGEVTTARRLESPSNIRWEITVAPDGDGDATVVLPATRDCDDQGAICTGDGRMLSAEVRLVVTGPGNGNSPATGAPTISGRAQAGETLTADTTSIADADGLHSATFSYQWLADDSDISGAAGSSYTLTDSEQGKAIKVRVSFTDDAGNSESLTSVSTAAVEDAPAPLTAQFLDAPSSHDGETAFTFELRFSEEFNLSYATLRDHAFTVTGGSVVEARRLERDSDTPNIRWEITVEPDTEDSIVVALPATTDCSSNGAICTGDRRMLSNRSELTVVG